MTIQRPRSNRSLIVFQSVGIVLAAIWCTNAYAAPKKVGVTVASETSVKGSGAGGNRTITKDSPIFYDDRLKADRTGNAQIILVDQTKIVVGPNAQVNITDFVYSDNNRKSFKSITIKITKGTFRFIKGRSHKSAFKFDTPNGSIGIRG